MQRLATSIPAASLSLALAAGCALPKVALGGSVSFGRSAGQDGAAHRRVHSALWVAMIYAPHARELERDPFDPEREAMPCAFELTCELEREAIAHEGDLSP